MVDHVGCTGKVDHAVVGGTGLQLVRVFFGDTFNQAALNRADHGLVDARGFGFDDFVQSFEAAHFFFMRRVIVQVGGRRARARTVNKDEAQVEGDVFDQFQGLLELALGLAREADDKVGAEAQIRTDGTQFADDGFVFQGGVAAFHRAQYAVGTTLNRQVQMGNQLRQVAVALDNRVGKFARMAGGKAQAFDAGDFVDNAQQSGKVADFAVFHFSAIGIDVLA